MLAADRQKKNEKQLVENNDQFCRDNWWEEYDVVMRRLLSGARRYKSDQISQNINRQLIDG